MESDLHRHLSKKKEYKWSTNTWEMLDVSNNKENTNQNYDEMLSN